MGGREREITGLRFIALKHMNINDIILLLYLMKRELQSKKELNFVQNINQFIVK